MSYEITLKSQELAEAYFEVVYSYSGKNSVFITREEREMFLKELAKGTNFVAIRDYVLSKNFIAIVPSKEKYEELHPQRPSYESGVDSTREMVRAMDEHKRQVMREREAKLFGGLK